MHITHKDTPAGKNPILTAEQRLRKGIVDSLPEPMWLALNDPETIEVLLNPDLDVYQEKLGRPMVKICEMERGAAEEVIRTVAGMVNKLVTAEQPILECEWPLDGSRFAAQIPPIVANPCWAIRKKAIQVFTLKDYVDAGAMTLAQCDVICRGIVDRKNIVVVGGTSSGKTTLGNAILHHISEVEPDGRLIIIEDTGELQSTAHNKVNFHTTLETSLTQLVRTTLRMRPDRVIVGEVRGPEALDLLQIWNTGHPGGLTTVHANDCVSALNRLKTLVSMHPYAPREIEPDIALAINLIVNIVKRDGTRHVREIVEVGDYSRQRLENNGYELKPIA